MKKLLTALIWLLVLTSLFAHPVAETVAEETSEAKVGDVTEGFVVTDTGRFDPIGADIVLYEHIKTGAQVLLLLNEDTNRAFEITFRTPAETDTGVPHVFEHSVLSGSEKYPSKTLFFNLIYQTYNTYVNASTYNVMTTYPIASLSEEQLLKYADLYTDSCFNPMVCYNKSIFDEEAWRYTLDEDGELAIEGTVYSEMLGANTRDNAAYFNFMKTIFPGSVAGNDFGGNPDHIPEMTWEDLRDYHEKYYTPSNSVTCIYGKIDNTDAFLSLLDGYFSKYERTEYDFTDSGYTPITRSVSETYEYAVEASTDTENSVTAYYGFALGNLTQDESCAVDLLSTLLNDSGSVVMENLRTALPYGSFNCYTDISGPEDIIYFQADNINEEDAELFRKTVDDSLLSISSSGFDDDAVDAVIASSRLSIMMSRENGDVGVNTIPYIMYYWAATGDLFYYMKYVDSVDDFASLVEDGSVMKALRELILENPRSAFALTKAVAGLKEEKDAELREKLREIKEAMTEEELSALTAAEETEDDDRTAEYVRELKAVGVEDLPEEIRIYDITDETGDDGIRRIEAECNTSGVGYAALLINTDRVGKDMLHYLKLYIDIIGSFDTPDHTRSQLMTLRNRYLYNSSISPRILDNPETGEYYPYLMISFYALDEDMEKAYDVIDELLFDGILDTRRIADAVSNVRQSVRGIVNNENYVVLLYDMIATADESTAYYSYTSLVEYYTFLGEVSSLLEENPQEVVSALEYIRDNLTSSSSAVSIFAGSSESAQNHRAAAEALLGKFKGPQAAAADYEFEKMGSSRALIVESNVNYNCMFASYEALGLEEFTADLDAVSNLIGDGYLMPGLRDRYGVYGAYTRAGDYGIYLFTYRDPNITESFDVYSGLPLYMESLKDLDQETLDGYILSSYSDYARSNGELNGAVTAILNHMVGIEQEKTIEYMEELKSLTTEKLLSYIPAYSALIEKGLYGTAGGASAIMKHAGIYEDIINPFGVQE